MDTFLKQIARRIVTDHPKETDEVLVVFNNNRSKRFFTRQFDTLGHASFLPRVMAIDEFISELGGLEIVPNEFLLFELYSIHVDIGGTGRKYQTFEDFISFGDLMMSDFSEIDQYCVDARLIFDNLHNLKAIGEWDIENPDLTPFQQQYLEFYRSLYEYYTRLHKQLLSQRKAYSGMAYREVAEHIGSLADNCPWKAIYFIGFNALSRCEEKIIGEYVRLGIGHLLTDSDIYYLEPNQEAGYFLDKHMSDFPELRPVGPSHFETHPKKITIVDCPENILQCKFAGQLLAERPELLSDGEAESTAVVLADESLLIPTLNSLPDLPFNYSVNITMGYAYSDSTIHALVCKLFSLYRQQNARGFYHSDVVEVMSDRFVTHLAEVPHLRHEAERFIRRDNRIRCSSSDLRDFLSPLTSHLSPLTSLFPEQKPSPTECLALLQQMAALITNSDLLDTNRKEKQAAGSLVEILDNLTLLNNTHPYIQNLETLEKIYSRIAQRHSIPLIGEPLTGLQILGMLETRNLDFKRVILLSANEGVLPAGRGNNTLIPNDLKIHFGLPTYVEKDSVYAYHFYRLMQRADEVWLVYNSEVETLGKGEASRFIRQVESELAPRFQIEVAHVAVKSDAALTPARPQNEVAKTEAIMQRLHQMATHGLSPTSFCDYLECPLKYYYSRVLNINEVEAINEDLDASQLGDCIHSVLEQIYGAHLGEPLQASILRDALAHLPALMEQGFQSLYSGGRNTEGRNRFLFSVAETQLHNLIENEARSIDNGDQLTLLAVEAKIENHTLPNGVNLKGKIDRVDMLNGQLRIIDYKTGKLDKKEIAYISDSEAIPGKWLQLMWYALLFSHSNTHTFTHSHIHAFTHSSIQAFKAAIYPLRNLRSGAQYASWDGDEAITPDRLAAFEELLTDKTTLLMDPSEPFSATPSRTACRFCPARNFCQKSMQ